MSPVDDLDSQISEWVEAGLISDSQGQSLRAYEGKQDSQRAPFTVVLGIVFALALGTAAVLVVVPQILGSIPRPLRPIVFLIVAVGYALVGIRLHSSEFRFAKRLSDFVNLLSTGWVVAALAALLFAYGSRHSDVRSLVLALGVFAVCALRWRIEGSPLHAEAAVIASGFLLMSFLAVTGGIHDRSIVAILFIFVGLAWFFAANLLNLFPKSMIIILGVIYMIIGSEVAYSLSHSLGILLGIGLALATIGLDRATGFANRTNIVSGTIALAIWMLQWVLTAFGVSLPVFTVVLVMCGFASVFGLRRLSSASSAKVVEAASSAELSD